MFSLYFLPSLCYLLYLQIFNTAEGMLSTEQGVYVAEAVAAKNTKQAKGRFRVYDNDDDMVLLEYSFSILYF